MRGINTNIKHIKFFNRLKMKLLPWLNRFNKHVKRQTADRHKHNDNFLAAKKRIRLLRHVGQIVNISHEGLTDK